MGREDKIQEAVFFEQFSQVECFVRSLTYYRSLVEALMPNEDQDFWEEVTEALLGSAILAWHNVFGDCKSHVYWSKLIDNMPKKVRKDFKKHVNKGAYNKCRKDIKTLRNKYIAHRDRNWQKHIWNSPDIEIAKEIAMVYERWVNDLLQLQKENFDPMDFDATIQSAEDEIKNVIHKLKR